MSNANSSSIDVKSEDLAVKAVFKRYEGLVTVRTKAVKGKGAWYWSHLEPVLVRNPDTQIPKGVKLKCILCDTSFSASNPSRTASEHLKRGNCPNFSLTVNPISQIPPLASPSSMKNHGKRTQESVGTSTGAFTMNMVDNYRFGNDVNHHVVTTSGIAFGTNQIALSGGKEDLGPLALLEDSVKKLKSPKGSCNLSLSKEQAGVAFGFLADWFYESCESVSYSSLEHPKFKAFLNQVGLPGVSRREFLNVRLDSKYEEAKIESEARIRDSAFFQIACYGWEAKNGCNGDKCLVKFMVNLPNGTRVFHKVHYCDGGLLPSQYVEEVLWEAVRGVCNNDPHRCVGIVADKYKGKALRNIEIKNHWMINLPCVLQSFFSLAKEFYRELPLFRVVTDKCLKIANLINSNSQIRNSLNKFRLQGLELASFIRVPPSVSDVSKNLGPFIAMLEDILIRSRVLNVVVLDDSYKVLCLDDLIAREIADTIHDVGFWSEVEASHSLVKLVMGMAEEIEAEKPLIGQCLPLWEELRAKLKDWCTKYNYDKGLIDKIVERRFEMNYHPAWATAFVLDPLYLMRDSSGKYLPPFKYLTQKQEKDVDALVTRLLPMEESNAAIMELMKWRSEGLDPLYAQAVQVKQRDHRTGKMKIANPQSSRLVWETCLKDYKSLGKVASRLLFLHATSCGIKCDWSFTRSLGLEVSHKLAFVSAHAKLERRDFSSAEEKDPELFGDMSCDNDMLNEVLADT